MKKEHQLTVELIRTGVVDAQGDMIETSGVTLPEVPIPVLVDGNLDKPPIGKADLRMRKDGMILADITLLMTDEEFEISKRCQMFGPSFVAKDTEVSPQGIQIYRKTEFLCLGLYPKEVPDED